MPIPDFQSLMRPLLEFISDGRACPTQEAVAHLADQFQLSETERKQLLPSGRQAVFANRLAWAKTHLKMAGLLEGTTRGVFRITIRRGFAGDAGQEGDFHHHIGFFQGSG